MQMTALLEVLTEGLGNESASYRTAAAAAVVAVICRILRRLSNKETSANAAAAPPAAAAAAAPLSSVISLSPDETVHARERHRDLLLLQHLLKQVLLLPLCLGTNTPQCLGGLTVLSAVLPLGGPACRCDAAREMLVETAFQALMGLLSRMQGRADAKTAAPEERPSDRCCSFHQGQQAEPALDAPKASVRLQCLQGIAVAGQFLVDVQRAARIEEAAAAATATTAAAISAGAGEQKGMLGTKTRRHLLLWTECLIKSLRHSAL